jgi:hypothetical protein
LIAKAPTKTPSASTNDVSQPTVQHSMMDPPVIARSVVHVTSTPSPPELGSTWTVPEFGVALARKAPLATNSRSRTEPEGGVVRTMKKILAKKRKLDHIAPPAFCGSLIPPVRKRLRKLSDTVRSLSDTLQNGPDSAHRQTDAKSNKNVKVKPIISGIVQARKELANLSLNNSFIKSKAKTPKTEELDEDSRDANDCVIRALDVETARGLVMEDHSIKHTAFPWKVGQQVWVVTITTTTDDSKAKTPSAENSAMSVAEITGFGKSEGGRSYVAVRVKWIWASHEIPLTVQHTEMTEDNYAMGTKEQYVWIHCLECPLQFQIHPEFQIDDAGTFAITAAPVTQFPVEAPSAMTTTKNQNP